MINTFKSLIISRTLMKSYDFDTFVPSIALCHCSAVYDLRGEGDGAEAKADEDV